ncbi:81_t:CDS:2 [Funneliformis mosseae]|uniref:81_t:CDS:1 n=1 Tax=Funneliformis mosseae TaxID=27381 RepID=A0A9N9D028_FUNMO|nr:81_t:CDS:2 [Funneliformis mosseae]
MQDYDKVFKRIKRAVENADKCENRLNNNCVRKRKRLSCLNDCTNRQNTTNLHVIDNHYLPDSD